ncbi:MAG: hypothetical protein KBT47_06180, partial [Armatimonadetes bacterium]|nr:hypothetical protein [Candidatus Hippobium faecium]
TLYMATEDTRAITKRFSCKKTSPDNMKFSVSLNPENMGVAGVDYEQPYEVNISTFEGDWYDGCKKYRKWGIENKYANFGKGKIEDRKDLPQWYKELPVWLRQEGFTEVQISRIIDFAKYLDVPVASHTYYWSQYGFDTHYPDILPAHDIYVEQIKRMHDANIKVMPYTNGQMADLALGNFAKEKNKEILIINEEGSPISENWPHAIAQGADNYVICPGSEYIDFQIENFGNIAKDLGIDALYVDEVCAGSGMPCFNWRHNHPMGGSYFRVEQYNRLFDNARGEMNKYVNDGVIITSESGAEPYTIDGWLRCNECDPMLDDCAAQTVVHSGYATSFGFYYYPAEFTNDNAQGAINKTAIALSKGYQLGWGFGWIDYNEFPLFAKYIKCACKARHKAYKYFNLGEMVRNVKIISELPKKNCYYQNFALEYNLDYPAVRTCSHNYKGKTAVTFTNIINEKVTFDWESFGKGLGLKDKKSYTISEFYPTEKEISKGEIKGTVTLEPLETKILIIE